MTISVQPVLGSAAARLNPVAKMAAVLIQTLALLTSIDWVSAAVAVSLNLILFAWAGLSWAEFWKRTFPVWLAGLLAGLTTSLYGRVSGQTYLDIWFIHVSDGSIALGLATSLRVLAIGLPGVVLFATTDPTDLADGLAQILRLPARFVLGGLAGVRLVGLFLDDWRQLSLARRARGVADTGNWLDRLKRFAGQAFALFVLSIRRGSKLATAMEAKGFGSSSVRTWARPSQLRRGDLLIVVLAVAVAAAAIASAVAAGTWVFLLRNT
ncbi:energy-coupling factor transport system permease protein [Propionicimonas paludicola]|uniref:Energy-coupling factor transport system permease protein n=1 Tax=Propionicimonas paludicola TaxID=185243 RepID=A0A2A9CRX3_9ACTN|nr:energy-coupling factor transporter transmembrane component T [Propionicimonas paludicola]PFG17163.1 energy-coupling factor transport system permease protein [Propionicimonas paludicola]